MYSLLAALTLSLILPQSPARSVADTYFQSIPVQRRFLPLANAVTIPTPIPVKKNNVAPLQLNARAVTVIDWDSGLPLYEKNSATPQPIASITKLMTALVVTSEKPNWSTLVTYDVADERPGGIAYLISGDQVSLSDLLAVSLVASSNGATMALKRGTGVSEEEFVAKMNAMAKTLGMRDTVFVDPTGLDPGNVSTARDVALLVRQTLQMPEIRSAVTKTSYQFTTQAGVTRTVRSTDELLRTTSPRFIILGGKTGYLDEAGYCFATAGQNKEGKKLVSVVLGADSKSGRFSATQQLLSWAFENYSWPK